MSKVKGLKVLNLEQIEQDLTAAMKAKDQVSVDVLRGLKTRITNEQIAKTTAKNGNLSEEDLHNLVRSEIKKRKEAAEAFTKGGREEMAEKELAEAKVLEKYLPAQMGEEELAKLIDQAIAESGFTAKDFGKAMSVLKVRVGTAADGATLAKFLKEKLK